MPVPSMLPLAHKLKFVVANIYGKTITKIEFAINFKVVFFSLSTNNRSVPIDTAGSVICFLYFFFRPFFILFSFLRWFFICRRNKLCILFFSERGKENVTNTWNFQGSSMNTIRVKWPGHRRRKKTNVYVFHLRNAYPQKFAWILEFVCDEERLSVTGVSLSKLSLNLFFDFVAKRIIWNPCSFFSLFHKRQKLFSMLCFLRFFRVFCSF